MDAVQSASQQRDRFVDLVRAVSILGVVLGHWLVGHLVWSGSEVTLGSSLGAAPQLWPLTWLLQVMPLFFFVGGFSNWASIDSTRRTGGGYAIFIDRRLRRLMIPTVVFVGAATAVSLVGLAAGGLGVDPAAEILTQPLWFLGVYVVVVALTPLTLAWHHRWGWWTPVALAVFTAVTDALRFALDLEWIAYLNTLTVWLLATHFGYLYREGKLRRRSARWLGVLGFASLCLLVALGPYPARMVGVPGDPFSNMNPPTLAIVALATWQVGAAVWLRDTLAPLLERRRVWAGVVGVNLSIMSIYLWHQAAMLVVARVALPLGLAQPEPATAEWWISRIVWIGLGGMMLGLAVAVVRRFEQIRPASTQAMSTAGAAATVGAVIHLAIGLLVLAGTVITTPFQPRVVLAGLHVVSALGFVHIGLAAALIRGARNRPALSLTAAGLATAVVSTLLGTGTGPIEPLPGLAVVEAVIAAAMTAAAVVTWIVKPSRRDPNVLCT